MILFGYNEGKIKLFGVSGAFNEIVMKTFFGEIQYCSYLKENKTNKIKRTESHFLELNTCFLSLTPEKLLHLNHRSH